MEIKNPLGAIRAKCIDCCCGSTREVKLCPSETCSLYPFRMGTNPYRKQRQYTEEQLDALREQLSKNRTTQIAVAER